MLALLLLALSCRVSTEETLLREPVAIAAVAGIADTTAFPAFQDARMKKVDGSANGNAAFSSLQETSLSFLRLELQMDTTRPTVPDQGVPYDMLFLVSPPDDSTTVVYRRLAAVVFYDSVSGPMYHSWVMDHGATLVGGTDFMYFFEFPDPGPSWSDYETFLDTLASDGRVDLVMHLTHESPVPPPASLPSIDAAGGASVLGSRRLP